VSPTWRWVDEPVVLAIHDAQLAEHGGRAGMPDLGPLRAALARPMNRAAYEAADAATLAAAYCFAIARDHPFVDGNKRTALVVAELFLLDNGFELIANDADTLASVLDLSEGTLAEDAFARWLRAHLRPVPGGETAPSEGDNDEH
jgi:death-on-curing protein